jgi:hypothetical protein
MSSDVFWTVFPLWINAFFITLAVEVPIFWLIGRRDRHARPRVARWRLAVAGAAGTCITHPLFWFVWPLVVSDYTWYVASGELLVAVIETITFMAAAYPLRFRYALAASFAANGASFGVGLLVNLS